MLNLGGTINTIRNEKEKEKWDLERDWSRMHNFEEQGLN
jgi:hypothetical protein